MAIDFPNSPTNGQTYTVGSFTWQYDGEKWIAANGITLDGLTDVTAPTPSSGDFLKWNGSAWVNDAIDLGTDTTGNYMSGVSAGTGISVTHTPSEGSTGTIAVDTAIVPLLASANTFSTNQTITASSSSDLLKITQTGAGNAFSVVDSTGGNGFYINSNGGIRTNNRSAEWKAWSNTATFGSSFYFDRSRGTTYDSHTAVQSGDRIGTHFFRGSDGTSFSSAVEITAEVDGTVSSGIVPGRLILSTENTAGTLTERMRIDSAGQVGIGGTPSAGKNLTIGKTITGATTSYSVLVNGTVQSDVTATAHGYSTSFGTVASAFTLTNLIHFRAIQATIGASSSVTNQFGFYVDSSLSGATTNNHAFNGNLAAATGSYNLYMGGTAANYLAGRLGVGSGATTQMVAIVNTTASDTALLVRGAASQSGALLETQNSAGTSLSVITSGGEYVSNHTASISPVTGVGSRIQTHSTSSLNTSISVMRWANDNAQTFYTMSKSRGTTVGSHVAVTSGDYMGTIIATGSDGASFIESARVQFAVDGAVSTGIVPGRIEFTTNNSAGTRVERMRIDSAGNVGIGGTAVAGRSLAIPKSLTGSTTAVGVISNGTIQSDVTAEANGFRSVINTAAASFTLTNLLHFYVAPSATPGAGSIITTQIGFAVANTMTGASSNNYAFYGDIASGTGRYNLMMNGTAANYMAGRLGVGATNTTGAMVAITNTTAADDALIIKGAASQSGYLTEWQNSAGTTVAYVNPDGTSSFGGNPLTSSQVAAVLLMDVGA